MRPARRKGRQQALDSSLFLPGVPQAMLAGFAAGDMALSPHTRPRRLKAGWSIRLVWRNRTEGTSAVVTFRLSETLEFHLVETAWNFRGGMIVGAGEAGCG